MTTADEAHEKDYDAADDDDDDGVSILCGCILFQQILLFIYVGKFMRLEPQNNATLARWMQDEKWTWKWMERNENNGEENKERKTQYEPNGERRR